MMELTSTDSLLERIHLLPDELVELPQWALWRHMRPHPQADRETKVPFSIDGRRAKANDATTWASFDDAVRVFTDHLGGPDQYTGIMFAFSESDPFIGIDFDDCVEHDVIAEPVMMMLSELGGYAEISPSGRGVKCWARGSLPTSKTGRQTHKVEGFGAIELYQRGRFFTVTGWRVDR